MRPAFPLSDFCGVSKILSLALSLALVVSETAPAFAWDDDRNSFTSNRPQNFQNQYKPERNFSLSSQMDHKLQIQNTALQMRFSQRIIETKTSSLTLTPSNIPTLPQPKLQFGTANPKAFESVKTEIPKPLAVSRVEPKGFLGAIGNAFKPIVNAVKATFQAIGQAIGKVVQFFSVDKAKITYDVQRNRVMKENPNIREVSPGTFQVPPGQKAEHGGRTWEPGTTFQMNPNGGGIRLKEGVTMSPDMGGIQRADGNLLPVKMIGENGGAKPVGIDFTQIDPKTKFNFTQSVTMDGVGGIPAGTSMTYEGTKPGTESSLPTVVLSFQNSRIENPQKAFESLGNGKEPVTLARAEMTLKGAIYQVNSLYLNKGNETFYGSEKGEVFSLTQLESKNSAVQSKSTDLTQQSKKLSDDAVGAVNLSNHHMADLHKVTGTPATINFQTKEPLKTQGETTKTLQSQTQALAQHMDQGDYGKVANAVTDIETTQKALTGQIKTQQTQVETFQTYKRAVKGMEQSYVTMAAQADPETLKGPAVTQEQIDAAAPYFQEQKNEIRIQSVNAVKALNNMEKEGIITPAEKILKIAEIKVIRDHLLAAKPDNVGNAVVKTASVMEERFQAVSKDFDEAIFDHLDNAAEKYPKTMEAVGQSALAVAAGAAIVGLGYGLVTAPATTAVVVGSGAISQKTFEAMGLSPEAASFYSALATAPMSAATIKSNSMGNADSAVIRVAGNLFFRVRGFFNSVSESASDVFASQKGNILVPSRGKVSNPILSSRFNPVKTPYGDALQSMAPEALAARNSVQNGQALYKIGRIGKSEAGEAQFWAMENPLSPGFESRYGMPPGNLRKGGITFVEIGELKPGTPFVTRPAPPVGNNPGGGIEVVVAPGGIDLRSFSVGRRKP